MGTTPAPTRSHRGANRSLLDKLTGVLVCVTGLCMSSDGSDMLNLQVRRSLYTSGACLNARSPGWVGHGGQGYTHTLSLGAGGSAASRARRAGTEGMASGGRIDEFFYGALAQLQVSWRVTAMI